MKTKSERERVRTRIAKAIIHERYNGIDKFGPQYDASNGYWLGITTEELGEAAKAYLALMDAQGRADVGPYVTALMLELVQTAATAMGWIERLTANYSEEELDDVVRKIGPGSNPR